MIKLGMMAPFADGLITSGGFLRDYAGTLEECGVESVWTVEHVVVAAEYEPLYPYSESGRIPGPPQGVPMPDPLDTIAFMAGGSDALRFGTAMVVAPLHSPVVLAKRAATIDLLSGGRLMLGLGIGWQKEEYAAVGVPYQRRGARLDECIDAMRALWSQSPAGYRGDFVAFDRVHCLPRPASGAVRCPSCWAATANLPSGERAASPTAGSPTRSRLRSSRSGLTCCAPPPPAAPSKSPHGPGVAIRDVKGIRASSAGTSRRAPPAS
jgi:probable F420-dependent oxidoreductase